MRRYGHAGAAILLGGWVLMHPPVEQERGASEGYRVNLSAPFPSGWTHYMSFDTARECEEAKASDYKLAAEMARKSKKKDTSLEKELEKEMFNARCVPAESVYPPKGPAQK